MTLEREVSWSNAKRRSEVARGAAVVIAAGALAFWGASVAVGQASWAVREVRDAARVVGKKLAPECVRDEDCVLRPALITCCGTCPATRPYEAITVERLQQSQRDADDACAPSSRLCDPPVCPPVELGDVVHAVCTAGACRAVELPPAWIARVPGSADASTSESPCE